MRSIFDATIAKKANRPDAIPLQLARMHPGCTKSVLTANKTMYMVGSDFAELLSIFAF